jgi:hypothetical protein
VPEAFEYEQSARRITAPYERSWKPKGFTLISKLRNSFHLLPRMDLPRSLIGFAADDKFLAANS